MLSQPAHLREAADNRSGTYDAFLAELRHSESRGNYQAVNTLNFLGAYQFGEAALIDLGYVRRDRDIYDNDFSGGFTGKNGVRNIQDFLNNPEIQDKAAHAWMKIMWRYIRAKNLDRHAWKEIGGVVMAPSGMLAATHLLGWGGLKEFVESEGQVDPRDPYGMKLSTYIRRHGGFAVPFGPKAPANIGSGA